MLHLIAEAILARSPAPAHRWALRGAHGLRRIWWLLRRPRLEGCRVLAVDGAGRVLLVRHSYGKAHWMPPGGGMKRGEDPLATAMREFSEEIGCPLGDPRVVEVTVEPLHGATNRVHVVLGRCLGTPRPDRREIIEAVFFAPDALPGDLMPALHGRIEGWLAAR